MSNGLDGVVAAETVLSHVDGSAGRLVIRGHDVEELASGMPYDAVIGLLWDGFFDIAGVDLRIARGWVIAGVSCSLWPSLRKQMMSTTTSFLNFMR